MQTNGTGLGPSRHQIEWAMTLVCLGCMLVSLAVGILVVVLLDDITDAIELLNVRMTILETADKAKELIEDE